MASAKRYVAQRPADSEIGDCVVFVEPEGGEPYPLHHVKLHSDGLEWGYSGSGPADLALSILADYFEEIPTRAQLRRGDCDCWRLHQDFKRRFIAGAPSAGFVINAGQIEEWLAARDAEGQGDDAG